MAANPSIKAVSATKDATSTLIMALLDNTSRGMVQMRAYLSPSCTTEDASMRRDWCVESSYSNNITEIYKLVNCYKSAATEASSACIRAYTCNSGENCDSISCSVWKTSFNSEKNNISIDNTFGIIPIAVSNLILTPGDKSISVSWGDVNQTTSIWAYEIRLDQGATRLASGFRRKNVMPITNLNNGTEYRIIVRARSFDGYNGPWTEQSATPTGISCTIPACTIKVTQ